jgi:hypothetical protein
MAKFIISKDDLALAEAPDSELLIGIEPSVDDCDGVRCNAPEQNLGPHWHLRMTLPGIKTTYVIYVPDSGGGSL